MKTWGTFKISSKNIDWVEAKINYDSNPIEFTMKKEDFASAIFQDHAVSCLIEDNSDRLSSPYVKAVLENVISECPKEQKDIIRKLKELLEFVNRDQ